VTNHNQIGPIGHLASAATVAASSFGMRVTDLHDLLAAIDPNVWSEFRRVETSEEQSILAEL
jgi:hypothetical protein